jgi:prophage DNA circulation protein
MERQPNILVWRKPLLHLRREFPFIDGLAWTNQGPQAIYLALSWLIWGLDIITE